MNRLPLEKQIQITSMLCEGNSLRSISRIADCSINTVTKLLVDLGTACQEYHDKYVRDLRVKQVQCDEIWSFIYAKQKNLPEELKGKFGVGSIWTWVGMDAESKLVISYLVGNRDADYANIFMSDLASRITNRVQLTTDGLRAYLEAVENHLFIRVDYTQLIKLYGKSLDSESKEHRYSPAECTGVKAEVIAGRPNIENISTSYVERQNLTMRMNMRRFTRLTNGFSKKVENHQHAIALHFMYYNFVRIHKTLRVTPAMEAGITKHLWKIKDLVNLVNKK